MLKRLPKKEIEIIFIFLFLIYGIYLIYSGTSLFDTGFKNIDLAYNTCLFVNDVNVNSNSTLNYRSYLDFTNKGTTIPLTLAYSLGANQIYNGKNKTIFGGILLTAMLISILYEIRKSTRISKKR